ncbi:hypothetical protein M192_gp036 [Halorubrum tailed phage 8]|uniref:Uncharacterized protein n=2 Tax=Haloferacalesvirus TaxID=2843389 RepID=R4TL28_9CAUD|nr:hypothetical protein M192_gp036 [Halorubrum tailed phage 8]AGM10843.1 hypothetical protein HRTV8_99 [Halorubrum tailed phage 8]UBF19169.1 hypothetical protein HRTV-14_gp96 [Halorubrum phage HRTV-14]
MSRSERTGVEPEAISFGMSSRIVTPDSPLPYLLDGGQRGDEPDEHGVVD